MANMEKLIKMLEDEQVVAAVNACNTKEEVLAALKEKGVEITEEELKEMVAVAFGADEDKMNVDELDAVAGGNVTNDLKQIGRTTVQGLEWVGTNIVSGAVTAKDAVVDGAVWVGGKVADGAGWVGDRFSEGATWFCNKLRSFFH